MKLMSRSSARNTTASRSYGNVASVKADGAY